MDTLRQQLRAAALMLGVLIILAGVLYPMAITAVGQGAFGRQADGSLIRDAQGKVIGSSLIGQNFTTPRYFHPRPSAAGSDGYDARASAASNLAPDNQVLVDLVKERAVAYRQENSLPPEASVPVDAVTASASGLDPHITPANAYLQVSRVAKARGVPENDVMQLVKQHVEKRTLGFLGEARVNVLELNLALDERFPGGTVRP